MITHTEEKVNKTKKAGKSLKETKSKGQIIFTSKKKSTCNDCQSSQKQANITINSGLLLIKELFLHRFLFMYHLVKQKKRSTQNKVIVIKNNKKEGKNLFKKKQEHLDNFSYSF